MEQLPDELVQNILFRLSKKSIYDVQCVCKRWRSLLCVDPDFNIPYSSCRIPGCCSYLIRWTNCNSDQKLPLFAYKHILALVPDDQLDRAAQIRSPKFSAIPADVMSVLIQNDMSDLVVIGSIDGVFCLSYGVANNVVLWNPTTQDWHKAPRPNLPTNFHSAWSMGFASDPSGCYKVVRIVESRCSHYSDEIGPCPCCPVMIGAEVYDLRSNVWTKIEHPFTPGELTKTANHCNVIVKGVPYWSAELDFIISFDPSTDRISKFERPDRDSIITGWTLGEIEESLVMLLERQDKSVDVWRVSGETGHGQMFSVGPVDGVDRWLGCWKSGEFLVASDECGSDKKKLYDYRTKRTRMLPDFGTMECVSHDVFVYVGSLNSPLPPC